MKESKWPPKAYVIGAQKAGTTTLATWLGSHPHVSLSQPKETDFFTGRWDRGWDWYASCFKERHGAVLIDASPSYSMAPLPGAFPPGEQEPSLMQDVPRRIFASRPDAKFIYLLRDPIDRAYSAYWHARRSGYERKPLAEAATACSLYIRASSYSHQIGHYLEFFPIERFLFLDFRQLRRDPEAVLRQCWAFIDVVPTKPPVLDAKNEAFRFNVVGRLITSVVGGNRRDSFIKRHVTRRLPPPARRVLRRLLTANVPPMREEERAWLSRQLADEYAKTVGLTGIDFRRRLPEEE